MTTVVPGLVSTIIPAFNRSQMMREAAESVLRQTYRPIEVILVNDGSTDDTAAEADRLASLYLGIVFAHHKANSGAGPSREAGRQIARGEYIQYLDSDDLLCPDKFRLQVEALQRNPQAGAVYGWIQLQNEAGVSGASPYKKSAEVRETLFPWILSDRWWNTNAPLWRRTVCDQLGSWSDLRWSQDWEYDGRAGALGIRLAHVPAFVTIQRQHVGLRQTSNSDWTRPERIANRVQFFRLLLKHAETAGIPADDPHRKHFTRWIFSWVRNAAIAGQIEFARELMGLAIKSAGDCRESKRGFKLYQRASWLVGERNAARVLELIGNLKRPGKLTLHESFCESDVQSGKQSN
jgi:glycosyltransferase involved in cell wall biosynthesis